MVEQRNGNGMDFTHNKVFLSASPFLAGQYARNEYGSEFVTYIMKFLIRLMDFKHEQKIQGKSFTLDLEKKYPNHPLLALVGSRFCPVIIRITNLPISHFEEKDQAMETLKCAYSSDDEETKNHYLKKVVLKLSEVCLPENLEYFIISSIGENKFMGDFDMELLRYHPKDQISLFSL